jgi:hypothetical protein
MRIALDLSTTVWRKSSYSDGSGGSCVEVVDGVTGVVPVRDSKLSGGPVLLVADDGWSCFVSAVKGGALDRY